MEKQKQISPLFPPLRIKFFYIKTYFPSEGVNGLLSLTSQISCLGITTNERMNARRYKHFKVTTTSIESPFKYVHVYKFNILFWHIKFLTNQTQQISSEYIKEKYFFLGMSIGYETGNFSFGQQYVKQLRNPTEF